MLPFRVHHLVVSRKHYLLLPKLNDEQMSILSRRLETEGFSVDFASTINAKSPRGVVHVDPAGLCWSLTDPEDWVIPAIPDLLRCPKQTIPLKDLASLYFRVKGHLARMIVRVESGAVWESLRATGQCGLTPDEQAIASALLNGAGDCPLVCDYPGENPRPMVYGRRRYFSVRFGEARESRLTMIGEERASNAYLPRDGLIRPRPPVRLSDFEDSFSDLGEWCFFTHQ
jgi:hypothetical protein